ncbi:MAG: flagellar motor switch protein FliN [Proteobacteria bacterium]|nr:flagellar motor switch protein FliN [Pseudomonadota bacterium]
MADEKQPLDSQEPERPTTDMEALMDVEVEITAVLGTSLMPISQILKLGRGAVVELNRGVGEDIDVHANNRLVAKGEVIVVDDRLGVTMTEIIKTLI